MIQFRECSGNKIKIFILNTEAWTTLVVDYKAFCYASKEGQFKFTSLDVCAQYDSNLNMLNHSAPPNKEVFY